MKRKRSLARTLAPHPFSRRLSASRLALVPFLLLAASGALAGCSNKLVVDSCDPGTTAACECPPGQTGTELCSPLGTVGDCVCTPDGTEPGLDPGTDAGTEPGTEPGTDPSGAPLGLEAAGVAPGEIDLVWRPVPDAGAAFRVYRDGALLATTAVPRHEDTTVSPGTTHQYTVTAVTTAGESPPSAAATATAHLPDENGNVSPGDLRSETTLQSIGFEWSLSGDANHNATATVRYRAVGTWAWRTALPLLRVDLSGQNNLAGSILFLEPATGYEVVLYLTDPDGGARTQRTLVTTRALPVLPTGGRTFHVAPGSGGGDGSEASPFRGVPSAAAAAKAGDVMLLHAGHYGGRVSFAVGGESGRPVAWKAAGDGDPIFAGVEVSASHLRLEGLRIEAGGGYDFPIGLRTAKSPTDVAVVRCTIVGNHYAIWLNGGGSNWYIADNVIVGDNAVSGGSWSGEGVELQHTSGHVVAHNRISLVGDGVSYCDRNCDIYGNDIFDTSDDGVETDFGYANLRIWGNRLHNTGHNGVSLQPMQGGPWYILRNQIIGQSEGPLKFRGADRFVFMHNTVVEWTNLGSIKGDQMLSAFSRNNVWISVKGGTIWDLGGAAPGWRTSIDYDGFDWAGASAPFRFQSSTYKDLQSFSEASGLERHGVALSRDCFPTLNVPRAPPASVPAQVVGLAAGCAAIDAGEILPNINDGYRGAAPDLGAFEAGAPPLHFGPR